MISRIRRPARADRLREAAEVLAAWAVLAVGFVSSGWAAATDISIYTDKPPATPRIMGPALFAGRPRSSFLYTVPATGQAPITFSAEGLPTGLSLAASSGTISGTMPEAGSYPVMITATNSAGTVSATLTLVSGDTLSLTPPLGWNSYDSFGGGVTEKEVLDAAQALKTHLQPFGWNYVVVDYLWYDREQLIDSDGRYLPSPSRFPSATGTLGFKPLADRVHAMGLLFGIHIMRGIPRKTVSANSPIAGGAYKAADANNGDTCPWDSHMYGVKGNTAAGQAWYDSIISQYASWGVDFIKVDDMVVGGNNYHKSEVEAIRKAIDKSGRSIVLSLSPGPMNTRDAANLNANANMWRMVNDFWDKNGLSSLNDEFNAAGNWQAVQGLTPGHWPDADMLPLGYIGPRCPAHGAGPTALSHNLQVLVMTLWGILPSPLMFGGNVPALGTDSTGPWTVALLTNEEVLAINQDSLGARAKRLRQDGNTEVWVRPLSGERKAVALFNRGSQDAAITVSFSKLEVSGPQVIRDVWRRKEVTGAASELSATVPHDSALMFTFSPPGGPDGGSGADAGGGRDGGAADVGQDAGGGGETPLDAGKDGGGEVRKDAGAGGADAGRGADSGGENARGDWADDIGSEAGDLPGCGCGVRSAGSERTAGLTATLLAISALHLENRRRRRAGHR